MSDKLRRIRDGLNSIDPTVRGKAFALCFETYGNKVFRIAFNLLRSTELAQDVVQDVFLGLWKSIDRTKEIELLPNYICRATTLTALAALKALGREKLDAARYNELNDDHSVSEAFPQKSVFEAPELVNEIVDTLSERKKRAIELRFGRDLSYAEIALDIGGNEDSVAKMFERVKADLQVRILEYNESLSK
jgi:RNA polymerase sigma factor (sigma-70 family)